MLQATPSEVPSSGKAASSKGAIRAAVLLLLHHSATAAGSLYGITRVRNSASCSGAVSGCAQLVSVDAATGALANVGAGHDPLVAVGDLAVAAGGTFYTLADGWNGTGTVLLGIDVADGSEACRRAVPSIGEVAIVGGGQSLVHDATHGRLLLAGLALNETTQHYHHLVLASKLPGCGPFEQLGTFGDGDFEPMAHATTFDAATQRLFVTVSTGAHGYGLATVHVPAAAPPAGAPAGPLPWSVVPMEDGATHVLWGAAWDAVGKVLAGPAVRAGGPGVDWRTLDPVRGAWSSRALAGDNASAFTSLDGNLGSVRAHDDAAGSGSGALYSLLGQGSGDDDAAHTMVLAEIDVATGAVVNSAPLHGDVGESGSILLQMALDASTPLEGM